MIDWRPHRLWIGLLVTAILVLACSAPLIGIAQKKADARLAALRADDDKAAGELRQLRADIAATEKLKSRIGEDEAEKSLAPVDRLRAAQGLERRAAESRLSRFSYTFSPERQTPIETVGAGRQDLATSQLTIAAEAPTDLDAYVFLDAVQRALPGRVSLRAFSLTRATPTDAPVTAANVKLTATYEWLSNGAAQNLAEGSP